jgi:hypothetical protein
MWRDRLTFFAVFAPSAMLQDAKLFDQIARPDAIVIADRKAVGAAEQVLS